MSRDIMRLAYQLRNNIYASERNVRYLLAEAETADSFYQRLYLAEAQYQQQMCELYADYLEKLARELGEKDAKR